MFPPCCLTWGQTMVEVMKMMATSFKTSCAHTAALSTPTLQQATADPSLCRRLWTLTGRSGSVSCRVTAPFSWILVHTRFCLCPPRVYFPVLCKFWWLYGGVNGDLLQEVYAIPRSAAPRAPAPATGHCWPITPQETLKHSSGLVSVGSLGPGAHKVCLSPPSISGGYGVWF